VRLRALAVSYSCSVALNTMPCSWAFWAMASVLQSSSSAALDKLIRPCELTLMSQAIGRMLGSMIKNSGPFLISDR